MSLPVNRGPTVHRQQLSDKVDAVLSRLPTKETPQSAGGLPGWAKSLAIGAGVPLAGYGLYKLLAPEKEDKEKEPEEEKSASYPTLAKQSREIRINNQGITWGQRPQNIEIRHNFQMSPEAKQKLKAIEPYLPYVAGGLGALLVGGLGYSAYDEFFGDKKEDKEDKTASAYPTLAKQAETPFPFNHAQNLLYSPDGKGLFAGSNWLTTPRATDAPLKWLPWVEADTASQGAWGIPATYGAIPAALAALYGGYKLTDYILDKRRKATSEDDLASAKEEYEAALRDKNASADIDADFDLIAENAVSGVEKQSTALQTAGGLYGAYGILAALAAGIPAYTFFKNRSKRELISRALAERQEQRHGQGIRPIYAYSSEGAAEAGEDDNKLSLEV